MSRPPVSCAALAGRLGKGGPPGSRGRSRRPRPVVRALGQLWSRVSLMPGVWERPVTDSLHISQAWRGGPGRVLPMRTPRGATQARRAVTVCPFLAIARPVLGTGSVDTPVPGLRSGIDEILRHWHDLRFPLPRPRGRWPRGLKDQVEGRRAGPVAHEATDAPRGLRQPLFSTARDRVECACWRPPPCLPSLPGALRTNVGLICPRPPLRRGARETLSGRQTGSCG